MVRHSHLLFDMDGTLCDAERGIIESIEYTLTKNGIKEDNPEKLKSYIGPPLHAIFGTYFQQDTEAVEQAIIDFRAYFQKKGIHYYSLYPGIKELLLELKKQNRKIGVATSKPTKTAKRVLKILEVDHLFETIQGNNPDESLSSKKDIIRNALDQMGNPKAEQCIMIGDRKYDIEGAKANAITSIAVGYGFGTSKELQTAGAHYYAKDVADLKKIIC